METMPNQRALDAAKQLIDEMIARNYLSKDCYGFFGHRDKRETLCPGDLLYEHFKSWKNWHKECTVNIDDLINV